MPTTTINNSRRPIYIDVQSSYDYYTNNDVVCGVVRVHPTERPNGIKIAFKGRCKMVVRTDNGKNTHKSTLELFSYDRLLFSSSQVGASYEIVSRGIGSDGRVKLPFEFTFPNDVRIPPGTLYKERAGFEHQKGHPLPPSLGYTVSQGTKTDKYLVEYFLQVLIYRDATWAPGDIIKLTLPFRSTDSTTTPSELTVAHPKHTEFCIRHHKLDPRNAANPTTLTKLKWSTLSKYQRAIPEARWNITAHCPYRLAAGASIPISFSFRHLGRSPEIIAVPTVRIQQIRVKLRWILAVRVPYQGITGDRDVMDSIEENVFNTVFAAWNKTMRHGLELGELGELTLPHTAIPSFKSYGLRLAYRIKVVVDGECAGERFSVTALRDECRVICDVQRPLVPANATVPYQETPPVDEQLPAYEPAPSYEQETPCPGCAIGVDGAVDLHHSHCRS